MLAGLEGETVTPSEKREKKRMGRWSELGERTKAVWPLERLSCDWRAAARVWTRRVKSG